VTAQIDPLQCAHLDPWNESQIVAFHDPRRLPLEQISDRMKRSWGVGHYLYSRVQSEQAAALKTTHIVPCGCLFPLAGNWQVGALLESCAPCRSVLFASTFVPPTPGFRPPPHLARRTRLNGLSGTTTVQGVSKKREDCKVESGVRENGDAKKPANVQAKDLPVSGVTSSASFKPGEKRPITGATTCGSMARR